MALWEKNDTAAGAPKWLQTEVGAAPHAGMVENANAVWPNDIDEAFLVDETEAQVASNRAKGLKTPGWNVYNELPNGRKQVECLVAMKVSAAEAGDAGVTGNTAIEDTTVADS